MNKPFTSRRKAKIIRQPEEDGELMDSTAGNKTLGQENPPIVRRPIPLDSSRTKKRSSLRLSFGPGQTSMTDDSEPAPEVFTPRKSNLSRQAIEKNALRKSLAASLPTSGLRSRPVDDRPSYSIEHLNELKSSTPSTPQNLKSLSDVEDEAIHALDIASKFGSDLSFHQDPSIPTDAEIKEKKERRARLAREQDYLPLDSTSSHSDDDDPEKTFTLRTHKKEPESRLVHDDEDVAEGFDSFVSDGRISLSKKAEREQKRRHKAEIRDMINEAEGSSGEESSDSEVERRAEYEATQTRKGLDGMYHEEQDETTRRPRTPPKITPLPSLGACLEKLRGRLAEMEYTRGQKVKEMEMLAREKVNIEVREVEIQRLLAEAGERYEKLRQEAGIRNGEEQLTDVARNGLSLGRGLESFGNTSAMSMSNSE